MKIYNGEGIILGRLAARAAKDALLGEEVQVVNCEKIIISGKKTNTFAREKQRRDRRGYPARSAKLSRLPDKFVRRAIRGMLPWNFTRGKEAYRRVYCHIGMPSSVNVTELITLKDSSVKKLPTLKFVTVGEVCRQLGGKVSSAEKI